MFAYPSGRRPGRDSGDGGKRMSPKFFDVSRGVAALISGASGALLSVSPALASGPDVIISEISSAGAWTPTGAINGMRAYTFGAGFCNIGDQGASWDAAGPNHPIVAHAVYRLYEGRFEQLGVSWASHEPLPLPSAICSSCAWAGPAVLGPGCGTTTFATYTALPANLGGRFVVDPVTGQVGAPAAPTSTDPLYRRIRLLQSEITQAQQGALYFVQALVVHPEDAASGNAQNNASYRRLDFVSQDLHVLFRSSAYQERPAIYAWRDHGNGPNTPDESVMISRVGAPGDGEFIVASRVKPLVSGRWRYDYAVQNLGSARAASAFVAPLGAGAGATAFFYRDVERHSGEPFSNGDWTLDYMGGTAEWHCEQTHQQNPNANAIRWGEMFTFSFESATPPAAATREASIRLFAPGAPGAPESVRAAVVAPADAPCPGDTNADNQVDFRDLIRVITGFGLVGPNLPGDCNRDGAVDLLDLNLVLTAFGRSC